MIPLHVGVRAPEHWDEVEARQREAGDSAAPHLREQRRPPLATTLWDSFGFDPRWSDLDPADCVAAVIEDEDASFARYLAGSRVRAELAVTVACLARSASRATPLQRLLGGPEGFLYLNGWESVIDATVLQPGVSLRIADALGPTDRDLALRLINEDLTWWTLNLEGQRLQDPATGMTTVHPAAGTLRPILETSLGEPVVAAWHAPDDSEVRYIVPSNTPWDTIADWLAQQALPVYNPPAVRRHHRLRVVPAELQTLAESGAAKALDCFDQRVSDRRRELAAAMTQAREEADEMRHRLLYGKGAELVDAVAEVLDAAGIQVLDLDTALGGTVSADLLCSHGGRTVLVEVKSAGGSAGERLYGDLLRHLDAWRSTPGRGPVDGGVLLVNHEQKKHPLDRAVAPYTRPGFLDAQSEQVVTALALFDAWRVDDSSRVVALVFGGP